MPIFGSRVSNEWIPTDSVCRFNESWATYPIIEALLNLLSNEIARFSSRLVLMLRVKATGFERLSFVTTRGINLLTGTGELSYILREVIRRFFFVKVTSRRLQMRGGVLI